jgi:predicted RNA binding protein YcfA (HicA-like mRNA interferase family)
MTSGRLPRVSGKDVVAALRRGGWETSSVKGSHHYLRRPDRPGKVTVAVHGTEILKRKTLKSTLDQAGPTVEVLEDLL